MHWHTMNAYTPCECICTTYAMSELNKYTHICTQARTNARTQTNRHHSRIIIFKKSYTRIATNAIYVQFGSIDLFSLSAHSIQFTNTLLNSECAFHDTHTRTFTCTLCIANVCAWMKFEFNCNLSIHTHLHKQTNNGKPMHFNKQRHVFNYTTTTMQSHARFECNRCHEIKSHLDIFVMHLLMEEIIVVVVGRCCCCVFWNETKGECYSTHTYTKHMK